MKERRNSDLSIEYNLMGCHFHNQKLWPS